MPVGTQGAGYFGTGLNGYGMQGWVVTSCECAHERGARETHDFMGAGRDVHGNAAAVR